MAHIVLDVTGDPTAIETAIELARPQGTILLAGLSGGGKASSIVTEKLIYKELKIQAVISKGTEAVAAAVKLVESGKYPFEKMVTHTFPLKEVEKGLQTAGREIAGVEAIKVTLIP
jgi:alcohol dehydrogenase